MARSALLNFLQLQCCSGARAALLGRASQPDNAGDQELEVLKQATDGQELTFGDLGYGLQRIGRVPYYPDRGLNLLGEYLGLVHQV